MKEIERIVALMKDGYTLINRGTGWWLGPKSKPYKYQPSVFIDEEVINEMEHRNIIKVTVPSLSAKATLT